LWIVVRFHVKGCHRWIEITILGFVLPSTFRFYSNDDGTRVSGSAVADRRA
jgi:hypothetical protein